MVRRPPPVVGRLLGVAPAGGWGGVEMGLLLCSCRNATGLFQASIATTPPSPKASGHTTHPDILHTHPDIPPHLQSPYSCRKAKACSTARCRSATFLVAAWLISAAAMQSRTRGSLGDTLQGGGRRGPGLEHRGGWQRCRAGPGARWGTPCEGGGRQVRGLVNDSREWAAYTPTPVALMLGLCRLCPLLQAANDHTHS